MAVNLNLPNKSGWKKLTEHKMLVCHICKSYLHFIKRAMGLRQPGFRCYNFITIVSFQGKLWHTFADLEIDCKYFGMIDLLLCLMDSDK